jgi:hypothetical protein
MPPYKSPPGFDLMDLLVNRHNQNVPDYPTDVSAFDGMGAVSAPLVSIYKDAAERMAGTQKFLNTAKTLNPKVGEAAEWLAAKWPRVAAHMRINPKLISTSSAENPEMVLARTNTPPARVTEPITIDYTALGLKDNIGDVRNTMAHEATHVAQSLGNSRTSTLYRMANDLTGYHNNPFEQTARARGEVAQDGDYGWTAFRQYRLDPKVVDFAENAIKDSWGLPGHLELAASHPKQLTERLQTAIDTMRATAEQKGLVQSSADNMRHATGQYHNVNGAAEFKVGAPAYPDIGEAATVPRMLKDLAISRGAGYQGGFSNATATNLMTILKQRGIK